MHRYGQFSGYGNGSSLEANPLPKLEAPCPQDTVGQTAGQDDRGGFVKKAAQMTIASSRYVAIIVYLS